MLKFVSSSKYLRNGQHPTNDERVPFPWGSGNRNVGNKVTTFCRQQHPQDDDEEEEVMNN